MVSRECNQRSVNCPGNDTGDISFPPSVAKRRMVSASQPAWGLNSPTSHPPSSLKRSIIPAMLPHYCPNVSPNEIFGSTGATNRGFRISGEMQLSAHRFLIAQDGVLYRLADATFNRMLQNPREHAFAILAGQRVRMASLIVELIGGKPARVVRSTFATLTFDEDGHMDLGMFTRQQWALAESALDPVLVRTKPEENVLDAAARFIARGGRWRPSNSWARAINDAALGQVRCRRL